MDQSITRLPDYPITQCEDRAQREVRVDAGHAVVRHDAEPAVQASRRFAGYGLTMSKRRNSRNAPNAPAQPTGIRNSVIEHAHDFVDDDMPGIGAPDAARRRRRSRRRTEDRDDRDALHNRGWPEQNDQTSRPTAEPNVPGANGT